MSSCLSYCKRLMLCPGLCALPVLATSSAANPIIPNAKPAGRPPSGAAGDSIITYAKPAGHNSPHVAELVTGAPSRRANDAPLVDSWDCLRDMEAAWTQVRIFALSFNHRTSSAWFGSCMGSGTLLLTFSNSGTAFAPWRQHGPRCSAHANHSATLAMSTIPSNAICCNIGCCRRKF